MAPYASAACCSKLSLFSPFLIINKTLKEPYILDLSLSSHSNFLNPSLISASPLSRRLSSRSPAIALAGAAASPSYGKELAAAKKAASLAARLCQTVQKAILQSDVQSKSDKSPVTVTNYGSQALVSLVLRKELPSDSFSLVAEEDSGDLRNDGAKETLKRITKLVNDTLSADGTYNISFSEDDILIAIDSGKSEGGPLG